MPARSRSLAGVGGESGSRSPTAALRAIALERATDSLALPDIDADIAFDACLHPASLPRPIAGVPSTDRREAR